MAALPPQRADKNVSFLERAERSPSFEVLFDLARVLEVPITALVEDPSSDTDLSTTLGIAPISYPIPEPVVNAPEAKTLQGSDIERLHDAFKGIREAQKLADELRYKDTRYVCFRKIVF